MPNLKSLRDMIRRNGSQQRTQLKNDSECSFNLTDDEENENKRRGNSAGRARRGKSDIPMAMSELSSHRARGEPDEDKFLKELEHENRLLEQELKTLQKCQSRKAVLEQPEAYEDRTRDDLKNSSRNNSGQTS